MFFWLDKLDYSVHSLTIQTRSDNLIPTMALFVHLQINRISLKKKNKKTKPKETILTC